MTCTQEHLEGVSQTLNEIIHLRLEDEHMEDLWMHVFKSTSVIPKCDAKISDAKLKCSLAQDGTNDWRADQVRSLVLLHLLTWVWCVIMPLKRFFIRYSKCSLPAASTSDEAFRIQRALLRRGAVQQQQKGWYFVCVPLVWTPFHTNCHMTEALIWRSL